MISIQQVNKNFGRLQALKNISLELEKGKSYALVGPNGSGKTTLIKCILGLVIAAKGKIMVDGMPTAGKWQYREKIGYMPQIGRYPDNMKIGQIFEMAINIRKHPGQIDEELILAFGLKDMYNKRMHTLSGGTRQKVSAALAFLFNPEALILDEPTAGLDPVSVELLKEKVIRSKEDGRLVIISSHIMSDLDDLATDIIYIYEGDLMYDNSIHTLKSETNESRLGKAISKFITQTHSIHH
jgi:Cu-processing system ATP-binding protein